MVDQDGKLVFPDLRQAFDGMRNPQLQPDRRGLSSVGDLFRYTEEEGERPTLIAQRTPV